MSKPAGAVRRGPVSIRIVERPSFVVVGQEIATKPQSPEIPALWFGFAPRIVEIDHRAEPNVSYGVMWHDGNPMSVLHYLAAVSVGSPGGLPAGMVSRDVPAGTYASFSYPLSGLGKGWAEIFRSLLPKSGYVQVTGPYFERYDEAFDPATPDSRVEICLPVIPTPGRTR